METKEIQQNITKKRVLIYLEGLLITALLTGLALTYFNDHALLLTQVSLAGLGILFFINAFQQIEIKTTEDQKFGFSELLAWSIVPKVIFIGSAISSIGFLFYTIGNNPEGAIKMISIGVTSITICFILLAFFRLTGVKHLDDLKFVILKALPILVIGFYLLISV